MGQSSRRRKGKGGTSRSSTPTPTENAKHSNNAKTDSTSRTDKAAVVLDENALVVLTSEKRRGIYECDYCHTDISQQPRIRCAVCLEFDLCLDCFTTSDHGAMMARIKAANQTQTELNKDGIESSSIHHRSVELSLTEDPKTIWTAEEDLRLIDAIKEHGLGNWVDIADAIGGNGSVGKTAKRCMERYLDDYLGRYGHILPQWTEVARDQSCKAELAFVKATLAAPSKKEADKIRQTWIDTKLGRVGAPTVLPPRPHDAVHLLGSELAGFMPRRGDFDVEWENDAETALADMEFIRGDRPEDKELKLKVLQIYCEKLDEREKRKKFVLNRHLYDYRTYVQNDLKLPVDERDLVHRMRLFERFHTPDEHKQFISDILKAKRLRKEIAKLQMYRRIGIRTLAEAEMYELDKDRRQFHKKLEIDAKNKAAAAIANAKSGAKGGGTASKKKKFDLSKAPCRDLLSRKERALCERLQIYPVQYLEIKKALIHESLVNGLLDKESSNSSKRTIVKIDVERRGNIIEFLVRAGWINRKLGDAALRVVTPQPSSQN
eukprot:jgi/Psemu1/250307/estExt_Genewise1Plus.C_140246